MLAPARVPSPSVSFDGPALSLSTVVIDSIPDVVVMFPLPWKDEKREFYYKALAPYSLLFSTSELIELEARSSTKLL